MHQIGRLTSSAVVANDSGVRVVVRTDAWTGPPLAVAGLMPVEMTYDNGSTQPLRIQREDIALVTPSGERITPRAPSDVPAPGQTSDIVTERALVEGVLPPQEQITGFVFFPEPAEAEALNLRLDLVSATSGEPFGVIEIPFTLD